MACAPKSCYRFAPISDCLSRLMVKTTLVSADVNDLQVVTIKAPNGKVYIIRRASDANGLITIYLRTVTISNVLHEADIPVGVLNPWAGLYVLTVDNFVYQDCNGNNYPCMAFKVADTLDSETDYLLDLTLCGEPYGEYANTDYSREYNL